MRVVFPMSAPVMYRDTTQNIHVAFDLVRRESALFCTALWKRTEAGDRVLNFGESPLPGSLAGDRVSLVPDSLVGETSLRGVFIDPVIGAGGVLVSDCFQEYKRACSSDLVSSISIGAGDGEFSRLVFIHTLVASGNFCAAKEHWLYGVPNPAELSMYRLFSAFVRSKITLAVCSTCFIYSLFGVSFSESTGVYLPLPGIDVSGREDLGMCRWVNSDMNTLQYRTFFMNMDICVAFGRGFGAAEYINRACAILEEYDRGVYENAEGVL